MSELSFLILACIACYLAQIEAHLRQGRTDLIEVPMMDPKKAKCWLGISCIITGSSILSLILGMWIKSEFFLLPALLGLMIGPTALCLSLVLPRLKTYKREGQ